MPPAAVQAQQTFASSLRPEGPRLPNDKRKPWTPLYKGSRAPSPTSNNNNNNNVIANFKALPIKSSGSGRTQRKRKSRRANTRRRQ